MCSACQFTFKSCVGSHRFLIFLKGSKKMKSTLKKTKPNDYSYFEKIWDLRNRHMVKGLPEQYVFFSTYLVMKLTVFILCVNEEGLMLKWRGSRVVHHCLKYLSLFQILLDPREGNVISVLLVAMGISYHPRSVLNTLVSMAWKTACSHLLQQSSRKHLRSPRRVKPPFQAWR